MRPLSWKFWVIFFLAITPNNPIHFFHAYLQLPPTNSMINSLLRTCLAFYSIFYSTVSFVSMSLTLYHCHLSRSYWALKRLRDVTSFRKTFLIFLLNENFFILNISSTLYLFYGIYHNLLSTRIFKNVLASSYLLKFKAFKVQKVLLFFIP